MNCRRKCWRWAAWLPAVIVIVLAAGCASSQTGNPVDTHEEFFSQLPQLPADSADVRAASAIVPFDLTGADNWDNSGNVTVDGDMLTVTSDTGRLDWVMYRYNLGLDTTLGDLSVNMTVGSGEAYVLVGDYAAGFWNLNGPYTTSATISLAGGDYISSGMAVYVVIAVYNGAVVTVNSSSLEYDDQSAGATYLDNMAGIFASNCMPCHSTALHTQGIILDTYWNAFDNAAAALAKVQADHAPTGSGSMTSEEQGIFQDWIDGGKPYGADVDYTSDVQPIISSNCSGCHTGGGKLGGIDLDGYTNAMTNAAAAWSEIKVDGMPPGGPLTGEQKDKWLAWIEQGTPE